jgi:hypothetical protein
MGNVVGFISRRSATSCRIAAMPTSVKKPLTPLWPDRSSTSPRSIMLRTAGGSLGWFFSGPDRQVRSRMPSARYDGWPKCTANSRRMNSRSRASKGQDGGSDGPIMAGLLPRGDADGDAAPAAAGRMTGLGKGHDGGGGRSRLILRG